MKKYFLYSFRVKSNIYDLDLANKTIQIIILSVESYVEKTAENCHNCYIAEKRIVSKLSKISISNLIGQFEDLNEDYVKISRSYLF